MLDLLIHVTAVYFSCPANTISIKEGFYNSHTVLYYQGLNVSCHINSYKK